MEEKFNMLLIEDNPADARLIDIYLGEAYGEGFYSLEVAKSLTQGLELVSATSFDVILLDLTLPDSFGLDTFKKVAEKVGDTPIVVLTGVEDDKVGLNAMKLGAQDFLVKGKVKGKGLRRSINYSVERNKLHKELSENARMLRERTAELLVEKVKLAEAQKLARIGSWEWDINSNIITWSDELYELYGVEKEGFNATFEAFLNIVHVEDREMTQNVIQESLANHEPFNFYHRIVHSNGEVRIMHSRGEVIPNEEGRPAMMMGTGQDITERVQEEEMEKLATAATKSYNSVIIADSEGEVQWVNEGFTELTGYTLEQIKSSKSSLFKIIGSNKFQKNKSFNDIIINKKPVSFERADYTREGKKYWVITTITPVIGKNGEVERIISIDSDITLRKEMEEDLVKANQIAEHSLMKGNKALDELMKAKKQLEESMKVKEQFLANMSHEIRTPMNAIIGFTDLILKTKLLPDQKQYIDAIKAAGADLIVIINDILDFSKIQSGKVSFEQIKFSIKQLFGTLTDLMKQRANEKQLEIITHVDDRVPEHLVGDPTRLNQVFLNLVGNAIKFTEKGQVKVSVELLNEDEDSVQLKFAVSDTGIGIPKDKLHDIFEGFTQANSDTTRKYGGTGLGLTIVKQLVELQNGKIEVNSKVGEGSTFSFELTFQKKVLKPSAGSTYPTDEVSLENIEGLKILLVEDNILNTLLAKKVLSNWNWIVDVAENGLIATQKVQNNEYDIVLMDIQLPEMDGYEATHHIRKVLPAPKCNIPIIAMTAHAISGEAQKCFDAGMDDYISKPFDVKVLHKKIITVYNKNKVSV